ncbi:MAG TPA: DUF6036 family nucleotidyltransferase [Myxococcaceae bacterium]
MAQSEAELILRTLDGFLTGPARIRLLGGAAFVLGYGMARSTEDADLLEDDRELQALIDEAGFSEAVEATNRALEARGLYLTHIWGPEQQILTPEWRAHCRVVQGLGLVRLEVSVLGPLDLIASKLCRADELDLEDIRYLIAREQLSSEQIRAAMRTAVVPAVFTEVFPANLARLEAILGSR